MRLLIVMCTDQHDCLSIFIEERYRTATINEELVDTGRIYYTISELSTVMRTDQHGFIEERYRTATLNEKLLHTGNDIYIYDMGLLIVMCTDQHVVFGTQTLDLRFWDPSTSVWISLTGCEHWGHCVQAGITYGISLPAADGI